MQRRVGMKILVVRSPPYRHWVGHLKVVPKFVELTITEEKTGVRGEFDSKDTPGSHTGWVAQGSDGYLYGYNYPRANQGFGTTCWTRHCPDGEFNKLSEEEKSKMVADYHWHEVWDYQCPAPPKFLEQYNYMGFCERHQHVYHVEDGGFTKDTENLRGCWRCAMDIKEPEVHMDLIKHCWIGWYDPPMQFIVRHIDGTDAAGFKIFLPVPADVGAKMLGVPTYEAYATYIDWYKTQESTPRKVARVAKAIKDDFPPAVHKVVQIEIEPHDPQDRNCECYFCKPVTADDLYGFADDPAPMPRLGVKKE